MSTRRILMVPVALLMSAACSHPPVQVSTVDPSLNSRWHASLASPAALRGAVQMSGTASMAPTTDSSGTTITINLANASPGGQHPWAVRWGQCGAGMDTGEFGVVEAYKTLEVGADGHATGTATVQMRTPKTGSYFVVVRASAANMSTVVACGNLAPPTL